MKSKKKQKKVSVLFLLVLFFIGNYYLANLINNKVNQEVSSYTHTNVDNLRTSGHWNLSPFVIDDSATGVGAHNWTWAKTKPWCSGSGTFEEPYLIENVTIDGGNSGSCITIINSDKYFRIENCTVFNSGSEFFNAGIRLDHVGNGTLFNNNCSFNTNYGIYLYYSNNNTVSGNTANNNSFDGIYLYYSNNTTVSGNTANNNSFDGIRFYYSNNTTISGNTANNNSNGIGISNSDNTAVSGNTANNNSFDGIYLYYSDNTTVSGNTVDNNQDNGIFLYDSDNTAISGNTANNNSYGINLYHSNSTTVSGNTANNNGDNGISISNSDNTGVSGNTANNNRYGIYITDSDNNNISGNTVSNNQYNGINLYLSNSTTVSRNTANNNQDNGIYLYLSNSTTVLGNTANNNQYLGICIYHSDDNNTISGNTANNNQYHGICISNSDNNTVSGNTVSNNKYNGIYLYLSNSTTVSGNIVDNANMGINIESSDYNLFYKNYFYDNNINAYNNGTDNKWDNGVIGNYWDDYDGVDANDDGIGDTPYIISGTAGSQDNFPIWADGDSITPVITIIFPLPDSVFGLVAPNYNISIDELNLDTIWYTLDGGITNYTITDLTGTFNQLAWEALSEGSVIIRFYANDTAGNIGFIDVEVIIEIPEDQPIISYGNYYILFTFITILSFIILEKRKKK